MTLSVDTLVQGLIFVGLGYAIYQRYRTATSVTPPPSWQVWLVTKPRPLVRKIGFGVFLGTAAAAYTVWRLGLVERGTVYLLSFLGLTSLALLSNPDRWLAEAELYHRNPQRWRKVKEEAVADLKEKYWRIVAKRLVIVALIVVAILWYMSR